MLAKEKPGTLNFGSVGSGSLGHLSGELFRAMAGIRVTQIFYKGAPQVMTSLIGGEIQVYFVASMATALPQVKAGALKMLAVSTGKRWPSVPDVPTLAESGYPGFDMNDWNGLFAAEGVPAPLIQRMQQAVAEACKDAKVRERLDPSGAELVASTPAE